MELQPSPADEALPWKEIVTKAVHDMRTPVSAMRTAVEVLRMSTGHPERFPRLTGLIDKQLDDLTKQLEVLVSNPAAFCDEQSGTIGT